MVAIVVVSHSAALAASVIDFAKAMGGDKAHLEPAGGVEDGIGTDFELIGAAVERAREASGDDGVLVLMDLGSAVQTAQMVLELGELDPAEVRLVAAPLVEGAVAASINAGGGGSLDEVAAEAVGALRSKQAELGETSSPSASSSQGDELAATPVDAEMELPVRNRLGLHARPAAKLVEIATRHDATLLLSNATTGRGPATARSLTEIALLGVRGGHTLKVQASGPDADAVVEEVRALAETGFGEAWSGRLRVHWQARSQSDGPAGTPRPAEAPAADTLLQGIPASPGFADGPLRRIGGAPAVPDGDAEDPAAEAARLDDALAQVREDLAAARDDLVDRGRADEAAIFEAQGALATDDALLGPARRAIADQRHNAARAIHDASEDVAAQYEGLDDPYLRERAADVRDVGRRVMRTLLGETSSAAADGAVLVTDELLPGDAATLDPDRVAGVATAHGGATGHAAIIARSLGVPTVVGLGPSLLAVPEGTPLLLDGDAGTVRVDPDPAAAERHREQSAAADARHAVALEHAAGPAVTLDGVGIDVFANLGDIDGAPAAVEQGAEGVGLLRTEFLFLDRDELPDEDEQAEAYATVARGLGGRPLIIRTLDVGADKPLRALPQEPEANPFLGRRGIRLQLARRDLLVRAAARRAADGGGAPGQGHVPDGRDDRRGPRGPGGPRRGPPRPGHRSAPGGRGDGRGARRRGRCRALRARARLPLDRHERPRPVHDGRRARQRARGGARGGPRAGGPAAHRPHRARRPGARPLGRRVRRARRRRGRCAPSGGSRGIRAEHGPAPHRGRQADPARARPGARPRRSPARPRRRLGGRGTSDLVGALVTTTSRIARS